MTRGIRAREDPTRETTGKALPSCPPTRKASSLVSLWEGCFWKKDPYHSLPRLDSNGSGLRATCWNCV